MRTIESYEKTSLLYWYPKIKDLGIPTPKTIIYKIPKKELIGMRRENGVPVTMAAKVKPIADQFGYPLFLKTDQAAGKHSWNASCYVSCEEVLQNNIFGVIEANLNADIIGLPFKALVFREYIPMESTFTAFCGQMPIAKERRYFIKDGEIQCHHPYWCCSNDTEIMTETGFKLFKDLTEEDNVFSLNPETNEIELVKPEKQIAYKYNGKMVHIKNNNFDMLITPEHRIPVIKNKKIILIEAKDIHYNYRIPRTGIWVGNKKSNVTIGKTEYVAKDFFEFLGYFLSEGSYSKPDVKNSDRITLYQKSSGLKKITSCLDKLNIDYTLCKSKGKTRQAVSIHKTEYSVFAKYLNLGKSYEKYIPLDLKEYGPIYLKIFLDAFLFGDGHSRIQQNGFNSINSTERIYYTSSKKLADDICEIILKIGKRPSMHQHHKKAKFIIRGKEYMTKHPVYTIRECNSNCFIAGHPNGRKSRNVPYEFVDYNGMVYCVTLQKNHIIYIRRNGKCSWTGNCEDAIAEWIKYGENEKKMPKNWKDLLRGLNRQDGEEIELLSEYALRVANVLDGWWSVDFAKGKDGVWYLIDMAEGEMSFHDITCKHCPEEIRKQYEKQEPIDLPEVVLMEKVRITNKELIKKMDELTHVAGIMVSCPHCKKELHIEFNKPMKKEEAAKLVKNVEKIFTFAEVQKEFDDRRKNEKLRKNSV